jgi:catechol 2,3-dioxygenase-like lactoylglutathione lyase family enzyme
MTLIDHVGLCPSDIETSLRFYRDGVGLDVLFDVILEGNHESLLGVRTDSLRTVFLGDPERPTIAAIELLEVRGSSTPPGAEAAGLPHRGLCLVSFHVKVDEALARLRDLGMGGEPRTVPTPGGRAAMVVDPDGVMVELLSQTVSFASS